MLMAGQRTWADAGGLCCRAHPHCKGGWVRMAVFRASAATTPVGMPVTGGVCGLSVRSVDVSLAHGTGRPRRATVRWRGGDAPTHDLHRRAAAAALQLGAFTQSWRCDRRCRGRRWCACRAAHRRGGSVAPQAQQRQALAVLAIGMEQAKVARASQSPGQDVLQHQPQEVRTADGAQRLLAAVAVAIAERDLAIGAAHDVALLNHPAVQVAPQIDRRLVAIAHGLAIDHPALGHGAQTGGIAARCSLPEQSACWAGSPPQQWLRRRRHRSCRVCRSCSKA